MLLPLVVSSYQTLLLATNQVMSDGIDASDAAFDFTSSFQSPAPGNVLGNSSSPGVMILIFFSQINCPS